MDTFAHALIAYSHLHASTYRGDTIFFSITHPWWPYSMTLVRYHARGAKSVVLALGSVRYHDHW